MTNRGPQASKAARNERLFDLKARGMLIKDIANFLNMTERNVCAVLETARKRGDPRARSRGWGGDRRSASVMQQPGA